MMEKKSRIPRHDWEGYKQKYLLSPIDDLAQFFASLDPPVLWNTYKRRTKGWVKEKRGYKTQLTDAAMAKVINDPDVQDLTVQIIRGKLNAIEIVLSKLVKERDKLGMRDLNCAIDILRRELGESLAISENKNQNENEISLGEDFKRLVSGYI